MNFSMFEYSLDMVRLQCEIKRNDFNDIFKILVNDSNVNYREMSAITSYRHNFYIKDSFDNMDINPKYLFHWDLLEKVRIDKLEQCSFWVGACHNAKFDKSNYVDLVIEYNPNKCARSYYLDYILRNCFLNNDSTVVKKVDFAIDFPLDIKDVHLVRDYNSSYRVFDNGGSDRTYYMRKRGSNGAFKLYNKRLESNLDYDKTRYEVTLHINNSLKYIDSYKIDLSLFPNVRFTNSNQLCFGPFQKVTGTDKVLLLACMEHPEYLKELSRDKLSIFLRLSLESSFKYSGCSIQANKRTLSVPVTF